MARYERVIFAEDYTEAGKEAFEILDADGPDEVISFLSEWHYPGEHDSADELGHGTADETYYDENSGYWLSWNTGLGYIGLEYDTEFM